MPIKHIETDGIADTLDIQESGSSLQIPIDKVFETGGGDPTIWERAPVGYWGVCYKHLTAPPPFSGGIIHPTAADIIALTAKTEITGVKRNITVNFAMNEADWRAATGSVAAFPSSAAGRAFFITKNWGMPLGIVTSGFPALAAFDQTFSVELNGVTYTGVLANGAPPQYDGTAYIFQFLP